MSEMRYEVRGKLLVLPHWWWLFESPPPPSSFKQSGKNVVIKFVCLWGGSSPCSGSWLNLCAAGKSPAYNSSTDEQNTDLSIAEVTLHQFLSGCRVVGGITMAAGALMGDLPLFLLLSWTFLHLNHVPAVQCVLTKAESSKEKTLNIEKGNIWTLNSHFFVLISLTLQHSRDI